jgi:hypothetical protein
MSELDRYLDDLGARLDSARVQPRPDTRLVALVATGAVALVVALALSLVGGGGSGEHRAVPGVGPVDAIAKARAALQAPAGQMLHMRVRTDIQPPKRSSTEELWATADPLRWRQSYTTSGADEQEWAYGDGVYSTFDAKANRLKRVTGYTDDSPQARIRTVLGTSGGADEPSEDLQAALAKGALVDAGEVQVGGRTVRRLETKDKDDPKTLLVLIYDVDPVTFAPVGGERISYMPPKRKGGPRRAGPPPIRFTVEAYERLPIDEAQLAITTDSKTKVVELTQAEWMRRFRAVRRWERHCSKLRRSNPRADCGKRPTSP